MPGAARVVTAVLLSLCTVADTVPPIAGPVAMVGFISYMVGRDPFHLEHHLPNFIRCHMSECCQPPYIRDLPALERHLADRLSGTVHGQHLVQQLLPSIIDSHWRRQQQRRKALVLSLHGSAGVGKNYVAEQMVSSLYERGMSSQYVHLLVGSYHFPHSDAASVRTYADQLRRWVSGNVSACSRQVFIFDEVDKIPAKVLDAIKPFMDHYGRLDSANTADSVYLLLSNTGGAAINSIVLRQWADGLEREALTLRHFQSALADGAFSEQGGLHRADIIGSALIDFYIPFLPLERGHVRLCIKDEMQRRSFRHTDDHVERALAEVPFDDRAGHFSRFGCKGVASAVNLIMDRVEND